MGLVDDPAIDAISDPILVVVAVSTEAELLLPAVPLVCKELVVGEPDRVSFVGKVLCRRCIEEWSAT